MKILVTGAAGFIGFHLVRRLADAGCEVVGLDNLCPYYDPSLKAARLERLRQLSRFRFAAMDLVEADPLNALFAQEGFEIVVNLAAQAGVRHSLVDPQAYVRSNIEGFVNILEACRHNAVKHLVYASSSSVYGAVTKAPFSEHQSAGHPVSVYGASKKANELLAHSYSHLFGLPTTGLRLFTVYGPWGRPDMALFIFARAILAGEPIPVFNHGAMARDFTYIDDVVEAIARIIRRIPQADPQWSGQTPDPATSAAPYRIYNVGNQRPETLLRLISVLEECLGREASKQFMPMQPGDVAATYADVEELKRAIGFAPATPIETGVARFVSWYRDYYKV